MKQTTPDAEPTGTANKQIPPLDSFFNTVTRDLSLGKHTVANRLARWRSLPSKQQYYRGGEPQVPETDTEVRATSVNQLFDDSGNLRPAHEVAEARKISGDIDPDRVAATFLSGLPPEEESRLLKAYSPQTHNELQTALNSPEYDSEQLSDDLLRKAWDGALTRNGDEPSDLIPQFVPNIQALSFTFSAALLRNYHKGVYNQFQDAWDNDNIQKDEEMLLSQAWDAAQARHGHSSLSALATLAKVVTLHSGIVLTATYEQNPTSTEGAEMPDDEEIAAKIGPDSIESTQRCCSECGSTNVQVREMQMGAADEGQTVFISCKEPDCGKTDKKGY
jgi:DNA-directed RNA polymerase subunit M/transcription elongation factor TFIIS